MLNRWIGFVLGLALATPAWALDLKDLTSEERAQFRAEVRAYLLENPDVIREAIEALQVREAEEAAQADLALVAANKEALFNDGFSWVGGNPNGDITLVEFLDYRCGFCKRAHDEVASLLAADGNIRLIVKEFPILGDQSVVASRFAVATKQIAGGDGYKAIHDALMEFSGDITLPALRRMSDTLGLDTAAIEAHMMSETVSDEIRNTRALAQRLSISGTPTFVLEDEMLRGFLRSDQMKDLVNAKRG
ncbi:MAG: DsbA family protein [Pseudomonadota bacterium]